MKLAIIISLLPFLLLSQQKERTFADHFYFQFNIGTGVFKYNELSYSHNSSFYIDSKSFALVVDARIGFKNDYFKAEIAGKLFPQVSAGASVNLLSVARSLDKHLYFGPCIEYGYFRGEFAPGRSRLFGYGVDFFFKKFHAEFTYTKALDETPDKIDQRFLRFEVGYSFNLDSFRKKENRHG